ncbi:uncharacterized protein N7515_005704 [Penicillium bovifimosum]|uniref:Uncharacterized protein n=1 Tax=Penicillium bovifimosum TaxID=126998 RepID=A0A9W9L0E1_9EURO|nr:uncharacterized protein N7515_005704 [Penicillium bovifimosum]KAJ5129665.1 hypothetical protein N7515_005704 [Penicillium bovifimosum]
MSDPTRLDRATQIPAASRNLALCPWVSRSGRVYERADADALWPTVELEDSLEYVDDEYLLRFVLTQIQKSNVIVQIRAQHYIRPRCLSIPSDMVSDSYAVIQAEAARRVEWWIEQVKAGTAWLDRDVLFGPRRRMRRAN